MPKLGGGAGFNGIAIIILSHTVLQNIFDSYLRHGMFFMKINQQK